MNCACLYLPYPLYHRGLLNFAHAIGIRIDKCNFTFAFLAKRKKERERFPFSFLFCLPLLFFFTQPFLFYKPGQRYIYYVPFHYAIYMYSREGENSCIFVSQQTKSVNSIQFLLLTDAVFLLSSSQPPPATPHLRDYCPLSPSVRGRREMRPR